MHLFIIETMIMSTDIIFKTFVIIGVGVQGYVFPEAFSRCHLNDENVDNCLNESIEKALQLLGNSGIPSLGLPSINPIHTNYIEIGAGSSAVNLVQKYKNAKLFGLSNVKVKKAQLDFEKKVLSFTAFHPELRQEAEYTLNGKIMILPVYGTGDSEILLSGATLVHTLFFKDTTKNGKKYFHIEKYNLNATATRAHCDFKNLFDGDKVLGDNILTIINENSKVIFDDVRQSFGESYSVVFKAIADRLFDNIPVTDIFLE